MPDDMRKLRQAILYKDEVTVRQLLGKMSSSQINTPSEAGSAPLHWASTYNNARAVLALLQTPGVDVNVQDDDGLTAVVLAVQYCNVEVLELLLQDHRVELSLELEEQVGTYKGSQQEKRDVLRMIQKVGRRI